MLYTHTHKHTHLLRVDFEAEAAREDFDSGDFGFDADVFVMSLVLVVDDFEVGGEVLFDACFDGRGGSDLGDEAADD